MALHFPPSKKPTMSSGEQTFTKGNPDSAANDAARAVFPLPGGPTERKYDAGMNNTIFLPIN